MEESEGLANHAGNLLAWIAGFIDAAGVICIRKQVRATNKIVWVPVVEITTTCPVTADFFSESFAELGLPLYRCLREVTKPGWRNRHHLEIRGQNRVNQVLEATMPYLVTKQESAQLVLEFIGLRQDGNCLRAYTQWEMSLVRRVNALAMLRNK